MSWVEHEEDQVDPGVIFPGFRPGTKSAADFDNMAKSCRVGLGVKKGHWTSIGPGASVGSGCRLGDWTDIGPFAKVGVGVKFGPWACVGMDAVVDPGCQLESHEYVRSGYRRTVTGRQIRRRGFDHDREIHEHYDSLNTYGPSAMSYKDAWRVDLGRAKHLVAYLDLLPEYASERTLSRHWSNLFMGADSDGVEQVLRAWLPLSTYDLNNMAQAKYQHDHKITPYFWDDGEEPSGMEY